MKVGAAMVFLLAALILLFSPIGAPARAQAPPLPIVATGSVDMSVRIWDATGKEAQNFLAHDATVTCLAFSPDGKRLYSGGADKVVKFWNADDASLENSVDAHDKPVYCLALSPNGRILASGGGDSKVKLWDALTGKLLNTIAAHNGAVRALAWSPDGNLLASGGADRLIQVWRTDGNLAGTIVGHDEAVTGLAWTKNGRLISCSADGYLKLWNVADFSLIGRQKAHERAVNAIALNPDGRLASAGADGKLRLWSFTGTTFIDLSTTLCDKPINCLAWGRDGRLLITGGADKTLRYWNGKDMAPLLKIKAHDAAVTALAVGP